MVNNTYDTHNHTGRHYWLKHSYTESIYLYKVCSLSRQTPVRGCIDGHGCLLPLVYPAVAAVYGGVVGLAQEGGGGPHHRAGRERGGYESSDWSLHYLDVAAADPSLVSTENRG